MAVLAIPAALAFLAGCSEKAGDPDEVQAQIQSMSETASEFQREIMSDGVILQSEYVEAISMERQCVQDAGYEVGELEWHAGQLGFTTTHDVPVEYYDHNDDDPFEIVELTLDECREMYSSLVGYAMFLQSIPTASERNALLPVVRECLVGAGMDLATDVSARGVIDAVNDRLGEAYVGGDSEAAEGIENCVETHHTFFIAGP